LVLIFSGHIYVSCFQSFPFVSDFVNSIGLRKGNFQAVSRRKLACGASSVLLNSVINDILSRKRAEIESMKSNLPIEVSEIIKKIGSLKSKDVVMKAIKKQKGTLSVITQIKKKTPVVESICSSIDPELIGSQHYEAGAAAIAVCTDRHAFGFDFDTLKCIVKGQETYRSHFPGPLPVIAYDFFIDPIQICQAAACGAAAVCLNARVLIDPGSTHGLAAMLSAASGLGLEALVEVHNTDEAAAAVAAGAKLIGVSNRDMDTWQLATPVDGLTHLLQRPLPETVFGLVSMLPGNVTAVAMGGVNETLVAWSLRDAGYSAVVVGEAVIRASESRMAGSAYQAAYNEGKGLIRAFRSKGSVRFGPACSAAFYGKGEGAKETLGSISI